MSEIFYCHIKLSKAVKVAKYSFGHYEETPEDQKKKLLNMLHVPSALILILINNIIS
jgi:hypothetical protein